MTPTQIVHAICGSGRNDKCTAAEVAACYVCGGSASRGVTVSSWMTDSYTDQTRIAVPLASHVCESCCYVMSRLSQVPGRPPKDGKTAGGNFRNYSHLWEDGWVAPVFGDDGFQVESYANASKGQKPLIRSFLERNHRAPWFAAIADSGQKHVLPYAPINPAGRSGHVLFDEILVSVPNTTELINILCQLLTDGATKEELERGEYRPQTWIRLGKERLREFEREHGRARGGWFSLALWLAQRDEEAVSARMADEKAAADSKKQEEKANAKKQRANGKAGKPASRSRGDGKGRVPTSEKGASTARLLDAAPEPTASISEDKRDSGGVPDEPAKKVATGRAEQLGLFGDVEPGQAVRRKRTRH